MLAFAHIPTGATANEGFNINEVNNRFAQPAVALAAMRRNRDRRHLRPPAVAGMGSTSPSRHRPELLRAAHFPMDE